MGLAVTMPWHCIKLKNKPKLAGDMEADQLDEIRELVAQTLEAKGVLGKIRVRSCRMPMCARSRPPALRTPLLVE